ncbi:hypothetical protein EYF80_020748 [Liparis tanakae]|uniref:Uncharacterized protein n=1 Tax=Liparis tanakae TaxID=230148 RepID=A0A4Z2HUR4_9TELE|nr:hypothetical protein EYF80_020748 [Liparis tanakae]
MLENQPMATNVGSGDVTRTAQSGESSTRSHRTLRPVVVDGASSLRVRLRESAFPHRAGYSWRGQLHLARGTGLCWVGLWGCMGWGTAVRPSSLSSSKSSPNIKCLRLEEVSFGMLGNEVEGLFRGVDGAGPAPLRVAEKDVLRFEVSVEDVFALQHLHGLTDLLQEDADGSIKLNQSDSSNKSLMEPGSNQHLCGMACESMWVSCSLDNILSGYQTGSVPHNV